LYRKKRVGTESFLPESETPQLRNTYDHVNNAKVADISFKHAFFWHYSLSEIKISDLSQPVVDLLLGLFLKRQITDILWCRIITNIEKCCFSGICKSAARRWKGIVFVQVPMPLKSMLVFLTLTTGITHF